MLLLVLFIVALSRRYSASPHVPACTGRQKAQTQL